MNRTHCLNLIRRRRPAGPVTAPADAAVRLHPVQGVRAVVFDVYGTLFSSGVGDISLAAEQNFDACLRAALEARDIRITEAAAHVRLDDRLKDVIQKHHIRRREAGIVYPEVDIRDVWRELLDGLTAENLLVDAHGADVETLAIDYESRVNPTALMPGLRETLEELHRRGITLSIISNAQFYTPLLFEAHLGATLEQLNFSADASVWSYALLEAKPSTRLYTTAADRLVQQHGIPPEAVLYVGNDIRNDIWPAGKTGFQTALFAGDSRSLRRRTGDADCGHVLADIEITELPQLLDAVRGVS